MKEIRKQTVEQLEALGFEVHIHYHSALHKSGLSNPDQAPADKPKPTVKEEAKAAKDEMDEALAPEKTPAAKKAPKQADIMPEIRQLMVKATKALGVERLVELLGGFNAKRVQDIKKAKLGDFRDALVEAMKDE